MVVIRVHALWDGSVSLHLTVAILGQARLDLNLSLPALPHLIPSILHAWLAVCLRLVPGPLAASCAGRRSGSMVLASAAAPLTGLFACEAVAASCPATFLPFAASTVAVILHLCWHLCPFAAHDWYFLTVFVPAMHAPPLHCMSASEVVWILLAALTPMTGVGSANVWDSQRKRAKRMVFDVVFMQDLGGDRA